MSYDKSSNVETRYLEFSVSTGSISQIDVKDRFVMPSGTDWWMRITNVTNNGARISFNGIFLRVKK
ncbi:hypothetical protein [Tenacibaculum phage Larrie]|nr:hypothetical protein [Tenacibaculum phage Larrie]